MPYDITQMQPSRLELSSSDRLAARLLNATNELCEQNRVGVVTSAEQIKENGYYAYVSIALPDETQIMMIFDMSSVPDLAGWTAFTDAAGERMAGILAEGLPPGTPYAQCASGFAKHFLPGLAARGGYWEKLNEPASQDLREASLPRAP